jgi:hypothetical protein
MPTQNCNDTHEGQPIHSKQQIKQCKQLSVGRKIVLCGPGSERVVVTVVTGPHKIDGVLWIDYRFFKKGQEQVDSVALEDWAIIRNSQGEWNADNWIESFSKNHNHRKE